MKIGLLVAMATLAIVTTAGQANADECWLCHWVPEGYCYLTGYTDLGRQSCRTWQDNGYTYCETYGGPCVELEGVGVSDATTNVRYHLAFRDCGRGFTRVFAPGDVPDPVRKFELAFASGPATRLAAGDRVSDGGRGREVAVVNTGPPGMGAQPN